MGMISILCDFALRFHFFSSRHKGSRGAEHCGSFILRFKYIKIYISIHMQHIYIYKYCVYIYIYICNGPRFPVPNLSTISTRISFATLRKRCETTQNPHLICIHVLNSFNQLLLDKKINQPERRSLNFHEFPGFIEKAHCILIHHWGGWSLPLCPSYPWSMSPGIFVGGRFGVCRVCDLITCIQLAL